MIPTDPDIESHRTLSGTEPQAVLILPFNPGFAGRRAGIRQRKTPDRDNPSHGIFPCLTKNTDLTHSTHVFTVFSSSSPGSTPIIQPRQGHRHVNREPRTPTSGNHHQEEMHMESVNAKDRHGHTPLINAAKEGQKEFVMDLLRRGADVTATSMKGKTVLHYAAANGHTEIVQMLLEKGAGVDVRDREGHTPIMLAAIYGCNKTIQALLDGGATPSIKTSAGTTAAQYAENNSHPLAAALLKKAERAKPGNA